MKKSLIFFTVLLTAIFSYSCAAWAGVPSEVIPSNELEGSALETSVDNIIPESVNDTYEVDQDTTLEIDAPGVLENDSDADEDELTVVVVSEPTNGTLTINEDGSFTYTPDAGFIGEDTFTYQAYDGEAYSEAAIVKITVLKVNTAPEAVDDEYDVSQDTVLEIAASGVLANDSDAKCDELTAEVVSGPGNGTLTFNDDGSFTYIPNEGFTGLDTFKYKAYDGEAYSNIATVMITVLKVKTAPVAEDDFFEMDENTELVVSAPGVLENDSDVDGDELTAVLVSEPSNGWIDFYSDGSFTYYPDYGFSGQDTFTYKVFDGNANSYEATVSIEVYDTVLEIYGWDLEDGEYSLDDLSFLEDMENLKVLRLSSALSPDANLEPLAGLTGLEELVLYDCNLNNSDLQYLAGLTNLRVLELSWNSISDLSALSRLTSLRALDLSGNNISDLRALSGCINLEWLWLWSNNIDLSTLPQSLANLTILDLSENEIGNIDEDMGAILSNLKNLDYLALDNCKLKDISGLRMLASLERLRVLSLNDNNIQSIVPLKSLTNLGHIYPYENHIYLYENYDINFSDQANIDAYETLINNGVYVYLSQDSYLENTAPVAGDDFFEMDENTELAVSAPGVLENDSDVDGDELTAVLVSEPSNGWIDFYSDGSFTYYPDYGFSGQDTFTYKVFDGNANSYEATVSIEVYDTVLEIYGWDLEDGEYSLDDLSFLEDMENLKVLRLSSALSPDANLEPLAGLTGLEELVLYDCNLNNSDLQYLAGLTNLRVLELSWNSISDLSALSRLTSLRALDLSGNNISDLRALSGCINLEWLWLWSNNIDLSTLPQSLANLTILDLSWNNVSDLSVLSGYSNLQDLNLRSNNIDLSTLPQNLANLTILDLSENEIGNIDEDMGAILSNLKNLDYLALDNCKLKDISGLRMLASLERLRVLSLNDNNIQSIVPLKSLTNLGHIYPYENHIYLYENYDINFSDQANIDAYETLINNGVYVYLSQDSYLENTAPVAGDDFFEMDENTELAVSAPGVLENDSDADGDELTAVLVSEPSHGWIDFYSDGSFTYYPDYGFSGQDSFTYKAFDGNANSYEVTVTIEVLDTVLEIYGWDLPYGAYSLDDLSFLEDIENLKVLRLWNALSPDANFEPLAGLTGLEELVLFDCNLDNNDLQYLANLIGLRVLNLSWNNINDFTFLSGLTNLEQLSLWSCEIEDISSFPKNLINLRVLDLEDNYINDLGALSGFTNLENLHLAWNCIESLRTFPQSLTKLRVLDLGGNKISDLSALSECINLEDLWLWSNNIQDLSTLPQNLINLICLDLSRNKITDISALSVFTNLETLSLSCNDFGNIDEDKGAILSQLTNLNYLNLDDCELNDISGLSMMASLENLSMLSLRSNNFQSIVPLAILTNLFDLYLYDNYDIDFNNPANIEALETLRNRGVYVYLSEDGNNSAPVALDDFYQVAQNAELIISAPGVLGNDWDDGDELQAELVRGPLNGTLTFNKDGAFTYIPNKGFTGKDTFTYKVFDGKAHSEIVTVTITVIEVSPDSKVPTGVAVTDGPKSTTITWNPVSEAVKYNIYRSYSSGKYYELIGTVDGQTYSYKDNSIVEPITYYYVVTSVNENNQESAFSIEGAVSFPEPPYVGAGYYEDTDDSLIYSGEWEEKSNEAASGGSFYCTSVPNASVTLFLSSGSEISILATKYPDGGIADIYVDGKKVGTVDFYSPTTLWKEKIFTISDLSWDTFHRVDIVATGTKNPSSSGYYINLDSLNIISDGDYSFELKAPRNVTATKDSDSVTISWEPYRHACEEDHYYIYRSNTSGTGFELIGIVNHPTASFKDTAIKAGTTSYYVVTTHIKWTNKESDYSSEVAITINTVPVAVNETYEVDQDTVLEIAAPGVLGNDTDADNDNLTAELVSEPTSGTLELNEDGSFTYTPDEGFTGEDSFIYKAYDGEAYSSEAEVTITVHKKDTEPVEPTTIESFDIGGTEFYAGGSYKLSANATSASKQQLYKFFVRDSNLNWTVLKDYNETNSVTWDATKPGQYLLVVHVKDSESTESYDTFTSRSVTVKDTTIESFTVGSGSDFYHGNSYTVSANADSANDQLYKFYVRDSNLNWTVLKEYSEANSATWDATKPGQYLLVVHVKDSESTKDYDTFTSMSVTVKETPTDINSFEIEGTSFFTGGSYKLSANATSASKQQLYKFFVRDSNLNWTVLKDYNETNSVTWDATKPGQYLLVVHVKDSESTESYDTFTSRSVTVKDTTIESFTVGSGSDFYHGNSYTVSANADSANDQLYKFYVRDSNLNWTVLKEYSEANSATWDATKPGQYLLVVHVKDSESTKDYDTFTSMSVTVKETPTDINSFEIEGTSFFTGGSYKLSANATSASKQQLYKFFVRDSNLNWTVLKDYNETNSVTWDATKPGQYLLVVHVKDSESTESYDTFTSRSVTVKDTTIESFTVGSGSDFYHGNSYTVSANADSANDQLYKFYVRDSNLNWTVLKEYSEANSATWDATKPGQYLLVVHVKDSESTKDYDTFTSMSVTVKETPTDINSFEIEGTSFFTGGSYNLSANATSASEQQLYKFFVRDSNLNWTVLKDYNEINSVTWNPTKPGQYLLVVHVKDSESTKDYDTFTSMSVTVKETPTVQAVLPSALKSYTLSANAIQC